MFSKVLSASFLFFYKYIQRRLRILNASSHETLQKHPSLEKLSASGKVVVCDVDGGLLRSPSSFPYFMLVALEGGIFLRGLLLLLLYPLLCCVSHEVGVRVMTMVSFCGLKKEGFRLGRSVLPKYLLEDVGLEGFEVLRRSTGRRVCISRMPRVMVEGFLKEYLEVEVVIGRELKETGGYYTGLMKEEEEMSKVLAMEELLGKEEVLKDGVVLFGIGGYANSLHTLFSRCKEVYLVSEEERRKWQPLPRSKYPKPLIFHDGRVAFRPTPSSTLAMFLWLPLGLPLAVARAAVFLSLPHSLSIPILAFIGMPSRFIIPSSPSTAPTGQLYVCNHRTLLDPIYISAVTRRNVAAATYSVSRLSEMLSPIRTIRLTRDREVDKQKMEALLQDGNLVVCPEGTTCREPYLLRFSPLFAELRRAIVPVALETRVGMFYGTTASGLKCLDPLFFLLNPSPCYRVEFLKEVEACRIEGKECSNYEMANYVQGEIGKALGFESTRLTRRDKYLMLADSDGLWKEWLSDGDAAAMMVKGWMHGALPTHVKIYAWETSRAF
ncbi:probable glycerol-3-phosphate acyltransferase 3 [Typha latifolia]|uniref:probable glycerol-3-phosphate acyltransferase 3 n=1 Tax=Typha latifolia TaxID=4733 RepID=UPI003C2F1E07